MTNDTEKPWKLPAKFHLSRKRDKTQDEILAAADQQQNEWRERFAVPGPSSPLDKARGRADIIVREHEAMMSAPKFKLTDAQREELGEAYAMLGRFDEAFRVTRNKGLKAEYREIWNAIQRDDGDKCDCGTARQFVMRDVWSVFHASYVSVVKCGGCGHINAIPTPGHIKTARARRADIRSKYSGMSPLDARDAMIADGLLD